MPEIRTLNCVSICYPYRTIESRAIPITILLSTGHVLVDVSISGDFNFLSEDGIPIPEGASLSVRAPEGVHTILTTKQGADITTEAWSGSERDYPAL